MPNYYARVFNEENIKLAISNMLKHQGSKTAGPDGITAKQIRNEEYSKTSLQIKNRLRGYIKVDSRTAEIPKDNGKLRTLTICNLYDRIAQQAVYQIIEPILDTKMSKHSYGFRKGISAKVPVAKIANIMKDAKNNYTVEIDFTKCFDNIPLDKAITAMRELGIKDPKLLKTVKHLMYISRDYNGTGLGQGTVLGPILANCYLTKLDRFMEESLDMSNKYSFTRDFAKHKDNYMEWLKSRGRKPKAYYFRYADDTIIICHSKAEQLWINETVKRFVEQELDVCINETKSEMNYNKCHFLGFYIFKNITRDKIGIRISKPEELVEVIQRCKFNGLNETWDFLKWYVGILNYYDIVNDMSNILKTIGERLWKRSSRHGSWIKRIGSSKFQYKYMDKVVTIDIYQLRKDTKTSFKEYLINSSWLTQRELLKVPEYNTTKWYHIYKHALWTKQKGKDPITNEPLVIGHMDIHHIKPKKLEGLDNMDNLILVNEETHKLIHSSEETKFRKIIQYRKHLVQNR